MELTKKVTIGALGIMTLDFFSRISTGYGLPEEIYKHLPETREYLETLYAVSRSPEPKATIALQSIEFMVPYLTAATWGIIKIGQMDRERNGKNKI